MTELANLEGVHLRCSCLSNLAVNKLITSKIQFF